MKLFFKDTHRKQKQRFLCTDILTRTYFAQRCMDTIWQFCSNHFIFHFQSVRGQHVAGVKTCGIKSLPIIGCRNVQNMTAVIQFLSIIENGFPIFPGYNKILTKLVGNPKNNCVYQAAVKDVLIRLIHNFIFLLCQIRPYLFFQRWRYFCMDAFKTQKIHFFHSVR